MSVLSKNHETAAQCKCLVALHFAQASPAYEEEDANFVPSRLRTLVRSTHGHTGTMTGVLFPVRHPIVPTKIRDCAPSLRSSDSD